MTKEKTKEKSSVKSYEHGIEAEKQKMAAYTNKFEKTVKSLQNDFKKHQKELKDAALKMCEDGTKEMDDKVRDFKGKIKTAAKAISSYADKFNTNVSKFRADIKNQIKENKEAVSKISYGTKLLLSEINNKKKDFQSYAKGPFQNYIKAFYG